MTDCHPGRCTAELHGVTAHAVSNPSATQELASGYSLAAAENAQEGSFVEGTCSGDKNE